MGRSAGRPGRWGWLAAILGGSAVGVLLLALFAMLNDSPGEDQPTVLDRPVETPSVTAGASAAAITAPNFTGTWHTNFALVTLTQAGSEVTGQYQRHTDNPPVQTVKGTVQGRVLTGKFDSRWDFAFTLADDGKTLDGYWIGADGLENEWCGAREQAEQPVGCGYSGAWLVKGLPAGWAIKGDSLSITQFDDSTTVKFDSERYGAPTWDATFDGTTLALATGQLTLGTGADMLTYSITFLVSEFKEWDGFKGTWRQTSPPGGQSGSWCGWRSGAPPPC